MSMLSIVMGHVAPVLADAPYETMSGSLPDFGPWAVVKPESDWNGTLILDLDGSVVSQAPLSPTVQWLVDNGYAYGGTSRGPVGYDFPKAVENLTVVRELFRAEHDTPTRTIAWGGSRGAFVGRLCLELRPEIFDAAIVMAGGGAGEIAVLNSKLDSLFTLKTLVDPESAMRIVGVANQTSSTDAETAALKALVELADSSPEGRARLSLAAAIEQFAPWTLASTTEPASSDYDAQYAQLTGFLFPGTMNYVFANPIVIRAPLEELAQGVVSWNEGVDYAQLLDASGRRHFVVAMYHKAGLDLAADLQTLSAAPRIAADPEAVAKAEVKTTYTGKIRGPIINLDNIGDPVDPPAMKLLYRAALKQAGREELLRISWVKSAGHGGQSDLERITAFVALMRRLDTGDWGDTSARAMSELALEILARPNSFPNPEISFVEHEPAATFLRAWDASSWGSYQPSETTRAPTASDPSHNQSLRGAATVASEMPSTATSESCAVSRRRPGRATNAAGLLLAAAFVLVSRRLALGRRSSRTAATSSP